eukprot:CAMPEP_0183335818 /NCGR_PEP_ID=MMETSP0164_2-20130417/3990_1 /TAXON_ID=221442 /ORGANISM="Coccolithus pelagicus ssp braarudi, Strain PLY182g" /LENGTH=249 /DNA_ID=CAMNT_0025505233 /DNA_START=8 /DNA_END=757 /DNA_ORIENTATION=+
MLGRGVKRKAFCTPLPSYHFYRSEQLAAGAVRATPTAQLVAIEGNIGAGKSTLLTELRRRLEAEPSIRFVDEPIDTWQNTGLLQAMYRKELGAATFQQTALITRAVPTLSAFGCDDVRFVISERSVLSDYHVFAKVNLQGVDLQAYELTHTSLMQLFPRHLLVHILHLDAPEQTLLQRISARARHSETAVTASYVRALGSAYERMLEHGDRAGWRVMREPSERSPADLADRVEDYLRDLLHRAKTKPTV